MIDINLLPLNITKHVNKFRNLLNSSETSFINLLGEIAENEKDKIICEWVQATWEIMVGEELLDRCIGLHTLTKKNEKCLLNPELEIGYVVIGVIDINHDCKKDQHHIVLNYHLRVLGFGSYNESSKLFKITFPFDIVSLIDDRNQNIYYYPISSIKFILYPISILSPE